MGCGASVEVYPGPGPMSRSLPDVGPHIDRADIKLPLTEKEIFSITRSWKTINSHMTDCGITMFMRMFEGRADVKAMFEQFRSVDRDELAVNRSLENHALLVMNALDESIGNLDDHAYLVDMLLLTGRSHRRFENFNHGIFWAIEEPFLAAVKSTLGERLTPKLEAIYKKAIHFILSTLTVGFKQDVKEVGSQVTVGAYH